LTKENIRVIHLQLVGISRQYIQGSSRPSLPWSLYEDMGAYTTPFVGVIVGVPHNKIHRRTKSFQWKMYRWNTVRFYTPSASLIKRSSWPFSLCPYPYCPILSHRCENVKTWSFVFRFFVIVCVLQCKVFAKPFANATYNRYLPCIVTTIVNYCRFGSYHIYAYIAYI